ncbi:MAG: hypothetical protein ACYC3X_00490 [Pirellulaceae bacterium]
MKIGWVEDPRFLRHGVPRGGLPCLLRNQTAGTSCGSGPTEYLHAVDREVLPALDAFRPQWLLLSAGFDALAGDPLAHLGLEPESFGPLTERLVAVADRHSQGRVVSVLEGGYDLAQLGAAVVAHLQALGQ